jgi:hypothetical protein
LVEKDENGYSLYDDDYVPDGRMNIMQLYIDIHNKELVEHYGGNKIKFGKLGDKIIYKVYFETEEKAKEAIAFLEAQLVAWRLMCSK